MKNCCVLLSAYLMLLPWSAGAAPKTTSPAFPPTDPTPLSLPEKGPLPVDATVAGLPVTLRGGNVIVSAGNNDSLTHVDLERNALKPFMALLKAYPNARFVELSWFEPIFLDATGADVLYDRAKHTVTVDYSYGGGEDPVHEGKVVFTGVRESVFAGILQAHPNGVPQDDAYSSDIAEKHGNNAAGWGGFQFLYQPRYGGHVQVSSAKHRLRPRRHSTGAHQRGGAQYERSGLTTNVNSGTMAA